MKTTKKKSGSIAKIAKSAIAKAKTFTRTAKPTAKPEPLSYDPRNQARIPFPQAAAIPPDIKWSLDYRLHMDDYQLFLRWTSDKAVEYSVYASIQPGELRSQSQRDFEIITLWPALRRLELMTKHKFLPEVLKGNL